METKEQAGYNPVWTHDCGGKMNYDCELVALSCRFWPRGGSFYAVDTGTGGVSGPEDRPEIKPSAVAHIAIGDLVKGPYEYLASAEFEAESEEEVKSKVEAWAKEMMPRVVAAVRKEFAAEAASAK